MELFVLRFYTRPTCERSVTCAQDEESCRKGSKQAPFRKADGYWRCCTWIVFNTSRIPGSFRAGLSSSPATDALVCAAEYMAPGDLQVEMR
jgi:hypothetical protein